MRLQYSISIAGKLADLKEFEQQTCCIGDTCTNIENIRRDNPDRAQPSQLKVYRGICGTKCCQAAGAEGRCADCHQLPIRNFAELQSQLNRYRPGDKISVTVDRNAAARHLLELKNDEGNTENHTQCRCNGQIGCDLPSFE